MKTPKVNVVKPEELVHVPRQDGSLVERKVSFLQAKNYTPVGKRQPTLIVLHSTENQDVKGLARAVANYFHGPSAPRASCHVVVDDSDVYRCVMDSDVAWGAGGANKVGLHLEMGGFAAQTSTMWSDAYSREVLFAAMGVCAAWCIRHSIGPVFLDAEALKAAGDSPVGITTHAEVTKAYRKSTHTDPGRGFPIEAFVNGVGWTILKLSNLEATASP